MAQENSVLFHEVTAQFPNRTRAIHNYSKHIFQKTLAESKKGITFAEQLRNTKAIQLKILYCGMEQLAARWAHNPKVTGSSPVPATRKPSEKSEGFFFSHSPDKHRPYAASIFDPYIHTLFATTHQLTRPYLLCSYEKQAQPFRYSQKIFRHSRISFTYSRLRCTHSQLYFTHSRLCCTCS